jgi:hypothetical protein
VPRPPIRSPMPVSPLESNEISIEHQYELYRTAPTKFQDIFEQVFDHLATKR